MAPGAIAYFCTLWRCIFACYRKVVEEKNQKIIIFLVYHLHIKNIFYIFVLRLRTKPTRLLVANSNEMTKFLVATSHE